MEIKIKQIACTDKTVYGLTEDGKLMQLFFTGKVTVPTKWIDITPEEL